MAATFDSGFVKANIENIQIEPFKAGDFKLPIELCLEVLSYLPPIDLANVSQLSRSWYVLSNDNSLWRPHFKEFFLETGVEDQASDAPKKNQKEAYVNLFKKIEASVPDSFIEHLFGGSRNFKANLHPLRLRTNHPPVDKNNLYEHIFSENVSIVSGIHNTPFIIANTYGVYEEDGKEPEVSRCPIILIQHTELDDCWNAFFTIGPMTQSMTFYPSTLEKPDDMPKTEKRFNPLSLLRAVMEEKVVDLPGSNNIGWRVQLA